MSSKITQKGFTLIELLVVIAIVTVLSVVVVLTLNPAELLRQARDSTRISDMGTLNSALSFYLADVTTVNLGVAANCYISLPSNGGLTVGTCGGRHATTTAIMATSSRAVDGTGWIPVNFNLITSGSPLGNLPSDPSNVSSTNLFYSYRNTTTSYELSTNMESTKFSSGGGGNVEGNDGGNDPNIYEVGNDPGLDL